MMINDKLIQLCDALSFPDGAYFSGEKDWLMW